MKLLRCRDAGFTCDSVVRENSEEEVLQQAARHAQDVHHVTLSKQNSNEIRGFIRDDR